MRVEIAAILLLFVVAVVNSSKDAERYDIKKAPELFEKFQKDYNRVYKDEADKKAHFEAFVDNLVKINKQNDADDSATYGINKFADYTKEDNQRLFGLNLPTRSK